MKGLKSISAPAPVKSNNQSKQESIYINFPEEEKREVDNYPTRKQPLIKKIKSKNDFDIKTPQVQIDLIKRKKRYDESPAVIMKCSECGQVNAYARKTSNNNDVTNIQCSNCLRETNLRGYLSFSDNLFYQRTQENSEWFDNNIHKLLVKEKPRIVKF